MNILDILFDADNCEPITLLDKNGKVTAYEQVAVIPYDHIIYCVLKPLDPIEGVGDEEAMVFRVDEREDGEYVISVEENESRAITIFEYYYDLLEKDAGKRREGDMGLKKEDKMDKGGILDELFDRAEKEIVLADEKGRELSFKAVFATVDNDAVYCILAPLEEVRGLSRNDALVFAVSRGQMFTPVKDKALCRKIFSEYYRFVREGGK